MKNFAYIFIFFGALTLCAGIWLIAKTPYQTGEELYFLGVIICVIVWFAFASLFKTVARIEDKLSEQKKGEKTS